MGVGVLLMDNVATNKWWRSKSKNKDVKLNIEDMQKLFNSCKRGCDE